MGGADHNIKMASGSVGLAVNNSRAMAMTSCPIEAGA
jgi:hypothetical protein